MIIKNLKNKIYKTLKNTEKLTGTDNVYIAKHGSYLTVGNIISIITAFILSIAFARLLPKETYGEYKYILSIFGLLALSSLSGINTAIVRGVAMGFDSVFKNGLLVKLKWSLLGSIASICLAIYFLIIGNSIFAISFLIISIFLPFFKAGEAYQFYLSGKKLFKKKTTYTTISQILSTILLIITLFLTKSLIILIFVYFASYSILRILFSILTINKYPSNKKNDPETISYGKHLSAIQILGLIANEADKILLFFFLGPIQLAIYSFAALPIQHIQSPFQTIQELALPKFSTQENGKIKKTLPKKLFKSIFFISIIIIIYIFIAPYFFKIFYPQYLESIFYSQLLSLTLLVFPMSMMLLALLAKKKTKELYKISIINPIFQILLLILLVPSFGIIGIIIAKIISQILYFFTTLYSFKKI
ncbi:oligosaccharide flippase family protein [Patescibacteria group bacterium]|nr:oligosaccharide flippase family protein [Patescibacteria group bacterium]